MYPIVVKRVFSLGLFPGKIYTSELYPNDDYLSSTQPDEDIVGPWVNGIVGSCVKGTVRLDIPIPAISDWA